MDSFTFFTPGHRAAAGDDEACSAAEQALTSKFDLLSTVLENVAQGVVMFDGSRRLLVWNDRYQQIVQYPDGFLQVGLSDWEMALYVAERGVCLLLIPSAAEILGFPANVSQCEQSVRVR